MPVLPLFVKMAIPAVLSQMINILYNLVDKMFIGHMKTGGVESLAGLGVTTPVILFLSAFAALVSMGGAPKAAIALGSNDKEKAERIMGSCLIWLACMVIPQCIIRIFTNDVALCKYSAAPLRTYLCLLCIYGIQVACQYSFVALDRAKTANFLTIWRKIIILIPLIFILPHVVANPTLGVFLAEPVADFIAVCTTGTLFYQYYKKLGKE